MDDSAACEIKCTVVRKWATDGVRDAAQRNAAQLIHHCDEANERTNEANELRTEHRKLAISLLLYCGTVVLYMVSVARRLSSVIVL